MLPEPDHNIGLDVHGFAANARQLILERPSNYRAFGVYWFLVKALLKKLYPPAEMPLLGDFEDQSVIDRMPKGLGLTELLSLASEEYAANMGLGTPRHRLEDPDGEFFILSDPDLEA